MFAPRLGAELTADGTEEGGLWGETNSKLQSQDLKKDRAEVHLQEMRKEGAGVMKDVKNGSVWYHLQ